MLIVYHSRLLDEDQQLLVRIDPRVHFWPRSWRYDYHYDFSLATEFLISFSRSHTGLIWIMLRPEHSEIIYKD